jgi:hypothetical protein
MEPVSLTHTRGRYAQPRKSTPHPQCTSLTMRHDPWFARNGHQPLDFF